MVYKWYSIIYLNIIPIIIKFDKGKKVRIKQYVLNVKRIRDNGNNRYICKAKDKNKYNR